VDDHLSRILPVAGRLKRPTWKIGRAAYSFRFGLASDEVYHARFPVTTAKSVVSYTAFSPLPARSRRFVSLWHCLGRSPPAGRYPASLPCEARTFLSRSLSAPAAAITRSASNTCYHKRNFIERTNFIFPPLRILWILFRPRINIVILKGRRFRPQYRCARLSYAARSRVVLSVAVHKLALSYGRAR
jgi:hypothetical protein